MTQLFICVLLLASAAGCRTFEVGLEPLATPTVAQVTSGSTPTNTAPGTPTGAKTAVALPSSPLPFTSERINFPLGATSYSFAASLTAGVPKAYVLGIIAGQRLLVSTGSGVTIRVLDTRGNPLSAEASSPGLWQGPVPESGDYTIVLEGQGTTNVTIVIPPPNTPAVTPTPG